MTRSKTPKFASDARVGNLFAFLALAFATLFFAPVSAWAQDPSGETPTSTVPAAPESAPSAAPEHVTAAATPSATPCEPCASTSTATTTADIDLRRGLAALARVESDLFVFGLFPNDAGFMDARMHLRGRYLRHFSSGLYFDYTTARALSENPGKTRADRLIKEYRLEADVMKGIFVLLDPKREGAKPLVGSLEPGINAKFLHQDVQESGYNRNAFDETQYRGSSTLLYSFITSLKLDGTLGVGRWLTVDVSGEWLPLVYTVEKGTTQSSQFADPVKSSITNSTNGWQGTAALVVDLERFGKYTLRGKAYRNQGQVSARTSLTTGNFQYEFETYSQAVREDYWLELIHTATYYKLFGVLAPAVGVAIQRKRFETRIDSLQADVIKLGFLLETP